MKPDSTERIDAMKLTIATGSSRKEKYWKNREITWQEFLKKVKTTYYTSETMAEYRKLPKARQDEIKDIGGFVGGRLKDGRRRNGYVVNRSMLTLDMDYAREDIWEQIKMFYSFACCVYSTHKHTRDNPRLRLIIPLLRPVSADEYQAVARKVAEDIGIEQFDDTTYEATRLMYWPSTSSDGEYVFEYQEGEWLDPDQVLSRYDDWKDTSSWPVSSRQRNILKRTVEKQADPVEKEGVIGAFCRTYTIEAAIEAYLPDVYEPCDSIPARYSYIPADSTAGVVVYDSRFAYSHHSSDPVCGRLCNAFDLVRIHLFGDLDDKAGEGTPPVKLPSFKAMQDTALNDAAVKRQLSKERIQEANTEFDVEDWQTALEINRKGQVTDTLSNFVLILENDPELKGIAFNMHRDDLDVFGEVPWRRLGPGWRDEDDNAAIEYISKNYGLWSPGKYRVAVSKVALDRAYHPVKEYLNSLPPWDGVPRVDTLLIDYMGAEDTEYVRAVTRKTLCAAVARILQPGVKFDHMLVLNGIQGLGKSTFFLKLGGRWFNDSLQLQDMRDKTAAEKLQGYWIVEIGEMAGMRKVEIETVKSFLSRQDDVYRSSFGRRATAHLRQCIIVGSTNHEQGFLRDITGNRRFWPVKVTRCCKASWEITDVEQIWAEALVLYSAGEKLYLTGTLALAAEEAQREAMETDEREGIIEDYLEKLLPVNWEEMNLYERRAFLMGDELSPEGVMRRETVCVLEIWCEALGRDPSTLKRQDSYEICGIMRRIKGWEQSGTKRTRIYGKQRSFCRKAEPDGTRD